TFSFSPSGSTRNFHMRSLLLAVALATLAVPALAVDYSDPRSVVAAMYEPYLAGDDYDWSGFIEEDLRSEKLNDLYWRDLNDANGEVGRLDFDPFVDGQDYDITGFEIGAPVPEGDRVVVPVSFKNM